MKNSEEIFRLLDQMPLSLLETVSRIEVTVLGRNRTSSLNQMAVTTPLASDRVLLNQLGRVIGKDSQALAFSVGAAAALCRVKREIKPAQLVLSGPEVDAGTARDTAAVVAQLISGAKRECLLITYVFSHADIPLGLLTTAARSGVHITCIFDLAPLKPNDLVTQETLKELLALKADVLCWNHPHGVEASMHAKGVVADRKHCLITSANLTARALTHNVELGVLLEDPVLCVEIIYHFEHLRESGWLTPFLPSS